MLLIIIIIIIIIKCNDVADLTSVIKIRLKKMIPRIRPFKVTQHHWNKRVDPTSMIAY